jgi:hypothetical protein
MTQMNRFLIKRDIPAAGAMLVFEPCGAAKAPKQSIDQTGADIRRRNSRVAGGQTFFIQSAEDRTVMENHAGLSEVSVTNITKVLRIIHPSAAYS